MFLQEKHCCASLLNKSTFWTNHFNEWFNDQMNQPFGWIVWINDWMTHSLSDLPQPTDSLSFIHKV